MSTLTEYGYAKDGKVYLNAYMEFPVREIGVVKESEEQSLEYFIKRFDLAKKKVEDLQAAALNTPNKGSYLMKLIHMRTYLAEFDGLGDFPALFAILDELETDIRSYVQDNRVKNYEIKQALLKEAELLRDDTNWNTSTKLFKDLKLRWIKTGSAHAEYEAQLNQTFDDHFATYFARKAKFFEERRLMVESRMAKYQELLDQITALVQTMPDDAFIKVKNIEKLWKLVGKVPARNFKDISLAFKGELNKFYGAIKRNRPQQPQTYKNPADRKKELVERVEKLVDYAEPSLEEVKGIQNEWKRLGKLKHPNDKDFNTRFKIACNEIFESAFLTKSARSKYEHFDEKTKFEQLKIKIRLLKDSIKEDEGELGKLNARDAASGFQQPPPQNRYGSQGGYQQGGYSQGGDNRPPIDMDKLNLINKLKTKQRMLKKLQDQLLTNY
ncbi:MAG: DUF349 domain-containing protein [Bernardetiaceae bacterium]|jgi:hypothetical protein|nr:DUF349 domain-containing protein [Bernardetiaceae bacterium]